jgi:predicted transcriptional regulator YheO
MSIEIENETLLKEAKKIVAALGKMFSPFCEVVLHDLRRPGQAIIAIECPLSGRKIGDSTTEMGLARIQNADFPDVVQNYANTFPDGRPAKSTSIGIKNSRGECIGALCLNMDISLFSSMQKVVEQLISIQSTHLPVKETLRSRSVDDLRQIIESYAAKFNMQPRALSADERHVLIQELNKAGLLQLRGAPSIIADILGISRASVYNALKR